MPQELLRSAVDVRGSQRRWFMLPVSIAAHGAVAVAWFVMPLTAAGDLPLPGPPSGIVRFVKLAPPPPPPLQRAPQRATLADPRPRIAPTEAPPTIAPEMPDPVVGPPGPPVEGALPAGVDVEGGLPLALTPTPPPPPPPIEPRPQLVRVGGTVREPKKIVHVAPIYPRIAQDAKIQGVVVLEAIIDTEGRIDRLRVLRSAPLLDEAAIAAVKEWRYTPTQLNGVPVPVLMTITVHFRLH
jgi:protein TonB